MMIITIDGPAGSGKSTVARLLAKELGFAYLDTGAMYRAVTVAALRGEVDMQNADALVRLAKKADIRLDKNSGYVKLDGRDVTADIRENDVSRKAGEFIAPNKEIRDILVEQQRKIVREWGDVVTEGRDQGSVVFPNAEVKVYLGCSAEERARRRHKELSERGQQVTLSQVLAEINKRDESDRSRKIGPLKPADGSVNLDTVGKTIEEAVDYLMRLVQSVQKKS